MNDGVAIALIGFGGICVAGLPATITALTHRRTTLRTAARTEEIAKAIGVQNGHGDVTTALGGVVDEVLKLKAEVGDVKRQMSTVQATSVMNGERLEEVGRSTRETRSALDEHIAATSEFIGETTTLDRAGRQGIIDRRKP